MFHDAVREAVCKDYLSALEDLTFNSKHYINMLTKLAKENLYFAKDIVAIVEAHIVKAPATQKLPVLYLVDSIVKNLKGHYLAEFAKNITILFVSVFEKVDCDTRKTLRRLRDTWDDVFSLETLYALDMRVRCIDPNWAIKSVPPTVDSSLSLTSSLRQPAANQLGLTGANTTEVRRQQQHRTTPVKENEETEPNPRMRCSDSAEGDTAIVSELRATSRAGELQREGAGFPPGPVNKKKRSCPGSPPPSLLLSKGKDSRSSESTSGVTFSSSARRGKGKRVPGRQFPLPKNVKEEKIHSTSIARFIPLEGAKDKQFKPFEEDLSHVNSDAQCSTRFECEPAAINKKKRIFSGSAVPLLPLSKRKDHRSPDRSPESILSSPANSGDGTQAKDFSQLANAADKTTSPSKKASDTQGVKRSLGGRASELTSRTYRSEREELRSLKHSRESLSQVALDPRLTGLSGPPCQRCPPRRHGPADLQNHPRQDPALFISPRRRDRGAHDGGHHVSYAAQPPHRARMPANTLGDAPQPFQTQQSALGGAHFNRLMPAGTPNVFNSQRTPLTHFYHPGALAPSTGHTNAPVPAGSIHQGMNARSGFGITQSCIASAQNCALLNQPGSQFESRASHSGHMNVNSLLTRLISSGLIKPTITAQAQAATTERVSEEQEEDNVQRVPDLTGFVKERMKRRYGGVVSELYAGRQCSSCGERFRSTHTRKYRDHLDWHYQQNSAKKNSQARAAHRAWYCRAQDWIEHDDSASLEEKAKKSRFFEQAQKEKTQGTREEGERDMHSVRAAVDVVNESCEICRELFDLTWEDDREQWCLKNAIRSDGKTYHPSCYEDYQNTL